MRVIGSRSDGVLLVGVGAGQAVLLDAAHGACSAPLDLQHPQVEQLGPWRDDGRALALVDGRHLARVLDQARVVWSLGQRPNPEAGGRFGNDPGERDAAHAAHAAAHVADARHREGQVVERHFDDSRDLFKQRTALKAELRAQGVTVSYPSARETDAAHPEWGTEPWKDETSAWPTDAIKARPDYWLPLPKGVDQHTHYELWDKSSKDWRDHTRVGSLIVVHHGTGTKEGGGGRISIKFEKPAPGPDSRWAKWKKLSDDEQP